MEKKEISCAAGIWFRKLQDLNDLEKQVQNDKCVWRERIENKAISKAWMTWRRWGAAFVVLATDRWQSTSERSSSRDNFYSSQSLNVS